MAAAVSVATLMLGLYLCGRLLVLMLSRNCCILCFIVVCVCPSFLPACRIEAIKAKQASRAAAGGSSDGAAAAAGGTRVYSKHIAIPIPIGGRAGGSAGATPQGSPARREPLLDAIAASLPQLEAPPVWQGFQVRAGWPVGCPFECSLLGRPAQLQLRATRFLAS